MKEPSYKMPENDPNYVLVHKRSLIAMSHCMGLALQSYSVCCGADLKQLTEQIGFYANDHAQTLSKRNLDRVIDQLLNYQGESSVIDLSELMNNENTN